MITAQESGTIITHVIDLTLPVGERLKEVIDAETETARILFAEAKKDLGKIPKLAVDAFGSLYRDYDGPYCAELNAWAKAVNGSFGELAVVNCSYELDHLVHRWSITELISKLIFGCTTGLREVPGLGMVHLRNLDWPIPTMGSATRLFHYRTKRHDFVAVGFPAFVGVLSGMVPGEYSVTINWAPPSDMPDFHWGPSFLLRKTLEDCKTYEQAVHRLCHAQLSTSVFYTVCGKASGQACVIERTADDFCIRHLTNGIEAQSNHPVDERFKYEERMAALEKYGPDPLLKTTGERRDQMKKSLEEFTGVAADLSEMMALLRTDLVNNEETVQRMVFCPAKGELHLECRFETSDKEVLWKQSVWKAHET